MRHGQRDRARAAGGQRLQLAIGAGDEPLLDRAGQDALAFADRGDA
jgi:hypothetical protein